MSDVVKCINCQVKISWDKGAVVSNSGFMCFRCRLLELEAENKLYRKALDFYASELSWKYELDYDALRDGGEIARNALKGDPDESI